jgi:hypothetical protein
VATYWKSKQMEWKGALKLPASDLKVTKSYCWKGFKSSSFLSNVGIISRTSWQVDLHFLKIHGGAIPSWKPAHSISNKSKCSFFFFQFSHTFFFFLFYFIIHMCIQSLGHFSPLPPPPPLPPNPLPPSPRHPLNTQQKLGISHNRKEQGFLLVEIRIAIQGVDSH